MKTSSGRIAMERAMSSIVSRKYPLREVILKTLSGAGQPQILEEVRAVFGVMLAEAKWPGSARHHGCCFDVEGGDGTGRHRLVLEQIPLEQLLDRDHAFRGRVRHGEELATAPDPNVASSIGHRRVKQGHVRANRRQQH